MNRINLVVLCAVTGLVSACQIPEPLPRVPERTMGVSGGPERVFDVPVAQLFPSLQTAIPTSENGRVGPALVFWEYQLDGGSKKTLYACLEPDELEDGLSCSERIVLICPSGKFFTEGVEELEGDITSFTCSFVGQVEPGDRYPNCADFQKKKGLQTGIVSCM